MIMKPYYSLKCYADGFPSLKYQFTTLLKAQIWAHNLLADGYHTVEVLRYTCGDFDLVETIQA